MSFRPHPRRLRSAVLLVLLLALTTALLAAPATAAPLGGLLDDTSLDGLLGAQEANSTVADEPCPLHGVTAAAPLSSDVSSLSAVAAPVSAVAAPVSAVAAPVDSVAAPVASLVSDDGDCSGVRPGALVQTESMTEDGGSCTFNFMFTDAAGTRYMGTAGHCLLLDATSGLLATSSSESVEERTFQPGSGPVATDADGNRIGEGAYAILGDNKDFGLIRLDPGVAADPQVCAFGGPTGINEELSGEPVTLNQYGQGLLVGQVAPARQQYALFGTPDPDQVFATGVAVPGDSGSPVLDQQGRAVGLVVTVGAHFAGFGEDEEPQVGLIGITRLAPQLARAQQTLGPLTLVTAPQR